MSDIEDLAGGFIPEIPSGKLRSSDARKAIRRGGYARCLHINADGEKCHGIAAKGFDQCIDHIDAERFDGVF